MAKFLAEVNVMPQKALLDPQGKAVNASLASIGYNTVSNLRIGKHITMEIEAENIEKAKIVTDEICKKILHNPVMENYTFDVHQ